jgi:TusA-related sulfurtransferase
MGTPIFKICGEDVNVDQAIADALAASSPTLTVLNIATSTVLTEWGTHVRVDATSSSVTVTLAAASPGEVIEVVKTDTSFNRVTVVPAAGTISGVASYIISNPFDSVQIRSDTSVEATAIGFYAPVLISSITTNTTLAGWGTHVRVDATSGPVTVTLAAALPGAVVEVVKVDTSVNRVTVVPAAGSISGDAAYALSNPFDSVQIRSDTSVEATVIGLYAPMFISPSPVTTSTALTGWGTHVRVDATAGPVTVTLAAASPGEVIEVVKTDTSVNRVTVVPAAGSISGDTEYILGNQFDSVQIRSDTSAEATVVGFYAPMFQSLTTITANYAPKFREFVLFNPSGATFTITLPLLTAGRRRSVALKNVTASPNQITVATSGGQTIDLVASLSVSGGFSYNEFVSDRSGTNWMRR